MPDRMRVTSLMMSKHNAATVCQQYCGHQVEVYQERNCFIGVLHLWPNPTSSESGALRASALSTSALSALTRTYAGVSDLRAQATLARAEVDSPAIAGLLDCRWLVDQRVPMKSRTWDQRLRVSCSIGPVIVE